MADVILPHEEAQTRSMTRNFRNTIGAAAVLFAAPVIAADCPQGLICASEPQTVDKALKAAGYETFPGASDDTGDPVVTAAAVGEVFPVFFRNCTNHAACQSLEFSAVCNSEDLSAAASRVNDNVRFATAAVADDVVLVTMDVTTVGGLNPANFSSVLDFWKIALAEAQTLIAGEAPCPP